MIDDTTTQDGTAEGARNPICDQLCKCTPAECGCEVFCDCTCICDGAELDGNEFAYDTSANFLSDDLGFKANQGWWERAVIDAGVP